MGVVSWIDRVARKFLYFNRKKYIDVGKPEGIEIIHTTETNKRIKRKLGRMGFYDNWLYSFYAKDEIENMALSYYNPNMEYDWAQYHVRMWRGEEHLQIECHFEAHAFLETDAHINKEMFDREKGLKLMAQILRDEEVEYTIRKH